MNNRIAWIAALVVAAFAPAAGAQSITAVYTTYSSTGVPTKLDIVGTGFCSTNPCGTKPPVVKLGTVTMALSGSSPTGIGVPLTGQPDGDYTLSVTPPGKSAINYAFTLKSNVGVPGPQGPAGPIGPAGPAGAQGPMGLQGLQGVKGDTGATGAQGPQGVQGLAGVAGTNGAQGPMGLQGPKGDKGDKGDTGPTGPAGTPASGNYRGAWNSTTSYAEGDLVYTSLEPSGAFRMCLYVASPRSAVAGTPNLNIPPTSSVDPLSSLSYWTALDPACRTSLSPYSSITPMSIGVGLWAEQMAFDGEYLWVANTYGQSLSKIRASDGSVAAVVSLGPYPRGLTFDGTYLWVSTENSNTLHKLRPSDGAVVGSYGVGAYPIAVMPLNGYVWTVNHQGASITKVSTDGTVIGTYSVGSYPHSITNDGTYIYTADRGASTVSKVDANTGALVATFAVGFVPTAITFDGNYLWIGAEGSGIQKMDPENGNILLSAGTNFAGCCGSINGLVVANGGLWGGDYTGGKVIKFNLTDGSVIDQLTVDASGPLSFIDAGGHLWVTIGSASKLLRF